MWWVEFVKEVMKDIEDIAQKPKPHVPIYGPFTVKNLDPSVIYRWCSCGLSKERIWCDDSCEGTDFKPLEWSCKGKVQTLYSLCGCKYTKAPPYCDTEHIYLPLKIKEQIEKCKVDHSKIFKICSNCGTKSDSCRWLLFFILLSNRFISNFTLNLCCFLNGRLSLSPRSRYITTWIIIVIILLNSL